MQQIISQLSSLNTLLSGGVKSECCHQKKDHFFCVPDTEELFKKNIVRQPSDWIYRNTPITYRSNELAYRYSSFAKVDWSESVVMLGCSLVRGVGVCEEDTISQQLSRIIDREVINLGVNGSSITFACYNIALLLENYPPPKAVVLVWTDYRRAMFFETPDKLATWGFNHHNYIHIGKWNKHIESLKYVITKDPNWAAHTFFAMKNVRLLCRGIPLVEVTFFPNTVSIANCTFLGDQIDLARDLMHFGPKTNRLAAECIATQLKKQGV